jgi:hypothetical protein
MGENEKSENQSVNTSDRGDPIKFIATHYNLSEGLALIWAVISDFSTMHGWSCPCGLSIFPVTRIYDCMPELSKEENSSITELTRRGFLKVDPKGWATLRENNFSAEGPRQNFGSWNQFHTEPFVKDWKAPLEAHFDFSPSMEVLITPEIQDFADCE